MNMNMPSLLELHLRLVNVWPTSNYFVEENNQRQKKSSILGNIMTALID